MPLTPPPSTRRAFVGRLGVVAAAFSLASRPLAATTLAPALSRAFDPVIHDFMEERDIPGAALAVSREGQLLYNRGYGVADRKEEAPAGPDSLFRIASLSKPITALAILKLVEEGRLQLDDAAFPMLSRDRRLPPPSQWPDGWGRITVRHLLHHTAGWDRDRSFDPMFRTRQIRRTLGLKGMPSPWDVIRFMCRHPLDHPPGQRYAYSNFGYCVLGRVIEMRSGQTYEAFVRRQLLAPLGIRDMQIGATRPAERPPREVSYHMAGKQKRQSILPEPPERVPAPDGGFWLECMDAHGGWVASARDLGRLTAALQAPASHAFLKAPTLRLIEEPPAPPVAREEGRLAPAFYGLGWMVRPQRGERRPNLWHAGSLPGTYAFWALLGDGIGYVILFNQRSADRARDAAIDPILGRAARSLAREP